MTINVPEKVIFSSKTIICFRIVFRKAKVIGKKKKTTTTSCTYHSHIMAVLPLFCPAFSYHTSQHFRVWWHNTSDTFPNHKEPLPLSGNHTELISANSQATTSIHTYKQHLICCTKHCQLCSTIKVVKNIKATARSEGVWACWEIQYPTCLLPLLLQLSKLYSQSSHHPIEPICWATVELCGLPHSWQ